MSGPGGQNPDKGNWGFDPHPRPLPRLGRSAHIPHEQGPGEDGPSETRITTSTERNVARANCGICRRNWSRRSPISKSGKRRRPAACSRSLSVGWAKPLTTCDGGRTHAQAGDLDVDLQASGDSGHHRVRPGRQAGLVCRPRRCRQESGRTGRLKKSNRRVLNLVAEI